MNKDDGLFDIVRVWAKYGLRDTATNPKPHEFSAPGDMRDASTHIDFIPWEVCRVEAAMTLAGKRTKARFLRRLLMEVFGRYRPLEGVRILDPGQRVPVDYGSPRLWRRAALTTFWTALYVEVKRVPKPAGVKDYEWA